LPLAAVNNTGGGVSSFFLARVFPSERERKLELAFYDLGDNSQSNVPAFSQGELYITTSPDVSASFATNLATLGQCKYTPPPPSTDGSRTLDQITNFTNMSTAAPHPCSVRYDAAFSPHGPNTWDGRWVKVEVTLPPRSAPNGYNCNTSATSTYADCWIMLNIDPDQGQLTDATTWKAGIQGGPVRLVG
jgi:hypothetical protein